MFARILMAGLIASCPLVADAQNIRFGDNSSEWAQDGECDDRRFRGVGMATDLDRADDRRDANDCKAAFEDGRIALWDQQQAAAATQCSAIRYGDNSSEWARDGECDDPRFEGPGSSAVVKAEDLRKDAADCKAACIKGRVFLRDY